MHDLMHRFLNFQYTLSKKLNLKLVRWLSTRDREAPDLLPRFEPDKAEMKRVFDKMSNNKEKIDLQDVKTLLERLKVCHAACEAGRIMRTADLNNDGFIDFEEFMEVHKKGGGIRTSDIQRAFRTFDRDGDGWISAEDIKNMMEKLGEDCTLEECQRMVENVDKNGDGLVGMDDFMAMMTKTMKLIRLPSSST